MWLGQVRWTGVVEEVLMRFWVDDRLVPAEQATVSVLDHGLTVADGVFETLQTVTTSSGELVPFAADRHVARLSRSAAGLGLAEPDPELVKVAMLAVCAANQDQLPDGGRVRVTYTSGPGPLGSARGSGRATLVVAVSPVTKWPDSTGVAMSPWPRNERSPLVGLKTTSYAENVVALAAAKAVGAGEALLSNLAGDLCEGTGSNFFLVVGGRALTPPLSSGCLPGITRELLLLWAAGAGLPVAEARLGVEDLARAQGAFITSSTRQVQRVSELLDATGTPIVQFESGADLVAEVARWFANQVRADPNP